MEWLASNWQYIVLGVVALGGVGISVYRFFKLPKEERFKKTSAWLLYAVTEAEKKLGDGTGAIKLTMVYDMFVTKFPLLSTFLSYTTFKYLVDKALDTMRTLLQENAKIEAYVSGGEVIEVKVDNPTVITGGESAVKVHENK